MSKKVWVIEDESENQVAATKIHQKNISTVHQNSTEQRNPSLAYSLSIIIWGCGQFYNKQWGLGVLLLLFMILFYAFIGIAVVYWEFITISFESVYVNRSETLLILSCFYLLGLVVWHFNAWQAYLRSIKMNQKASQGIKGKLLPVVCSLLMPGWGQLLNGQTKKGFIFGLLLLSSLVAIPFILFTFLLWPTLDASRSRYIIEWIFSISFILSPFLLLMWIMNIFDAAKVSIDPTKKKPLRIRSRYVINRFRYHVQVYGWKNALIALVKRNTLVIALLILGVINFRYVPEKFYMQELQHLGNRMSKKEMTVIPGIIKKLPNNISFGK